MNIQRRYEIGDNILSYTIIDKIKQKTSTRYLCKCECGSIKKLNASYFKLGRKCMYCRPLSLIGKKNEKTKFIKYIEHNKYECLCDCGKEFIGRERSKSCGCHIEENHIKDAKTLLGVKFNGITIKSFSHFEKKSAKGFRQTIYNAKCKCGKIFKIKRSQIFKAKTCGCRIVNNYSRGESQGNNKYKEEDVLAVRDFFLTGQYSRKQLSEMFKINIGSINTFINNRSWYHLKVDPDILKNSPVKEKFNKKIIKPEIGKSYGWWTVIKEVPSKNTHSFHLCECRCGNEHEVQSRSLINGNSTKCYDCNANNFADLKRTHNYEEYIGKKIGTRTILKIISKNPVRILSKCDCGNEKEMLIQPLLIGKSKNCDKCYPRIYRTDKFEESIISLYKNGFSYKVIMENLGCSAGVIRRFLIKNNIKTSKCRKRLN